MPAQAAEGWVRIPKAMRPPMIPKSHFEGFPGLRVKVESDGSWLVKTNESYLRAKKPELELTLLVRDSSFHTEGLGRLRALESLIQPMQNPELVAFMAAKKNFAKDQTEREPLWSRFAMNIQLCGDSELETTIRDLQSEGGPNDSTWLLEVDPFLSRRLAFMRAMFTQQQIGHGVDIRDFEGLPSARELMMHSSAAFTIYFHPLLLLNSPRIGGYIAMRSNAAIIRLLEVPQSGKVSVWGDQIDSFVPHYAGSGNVIWKNPPVANLESREEVLRWWTGRISELLWVLSDLTRYAESHGSYSPSAHLGATLTVERMFVTAVEIFRLRRVDEVLRKMLLFDLLDALDGHGMGDIEKNMSHRIQCDLWEKAKTILPDAVVEALGPLVEGAFEAIQKIGNEFWLPSIRTSEDEILVRQKNGDGIERVSLDRAQGEYLRVLRNSHHGFGKIAANPRSLSLLASHTGDLDNRLPDIVWWFLIRLLLDPSVIAPYKA